MQLEVRRTKNNKHLKGGRKKKKKEARMSKKFTSLKGIYRRKYFPSTFLTSLPFPFADHVQLICNQACNTQLVGSKTDKKKMANIWFTEIIYRILPPLLLPPSCHALLVEIILA